MPEVIVYSKLSTAIPIESILGQKPGTDGKIPRSGKGEIPMLETLAKTKQVSEQRTIDWGDKKSEYLDKLQLALDRTIETLEKKGYPKHTSEQDWQKDLFTATMVAIKSEPFFDYELKKGMFSPALNNIKEGQSFACAELSITAATIMCLAENNLVKNKGLHSHYYVMVGNKEGNQKMRHAFVVDADGFLVFDPTFNMHMQPVKKPRSLEDFAQTEYRSIDGKCKSTYGVFRGEETRKVIGSKKTSDAFQYLPEDVPVNPLSLPLPVNLNHQKSFQLFT